MKQTHKILLGLAAASAWLIAGSVTIPNTFTANTTAKASEVNGNFSAVKTAVDGNAGDIVTNEHNITANTSGIATNESKIIDNTNAILVNENKITTNASKILTNTGGISDNTSGIATNTNNITTNTTNIAGAITDINATGGLTGGGSSGSVTVRRASGSVAISPAAFHPSTDPSACFMQTKAWYAYFINTTTVDDCEAVAQVTLPDGATLKKLTCVVKDNDDAAHPVLSLFRHKPGSNAVVTFLHVTTSANDSGYQRIYDDDVPANYETVDNSQYTYHLRYDPPDNTSAAGMDQRLAGCIIDYSY